MRVPFDVQGLPRRHPASVRDVGGVPLQAAGPRPPSEEPSGSLHRWAFGLGLLLCAAVIGLAALATWVARERSLSDAGRELRTLSVALTEQTERTLQGADLALDIVEARARAEGALASPAVFVAWGEERRTHEGLAAAARAVPQVDALLVTDAQGIILSSSRMFPPAPRDLSDRDYFHRARDSRDRVVIGTPVVNRATGRWAFHVVRRIEGADGRFLGTKIAIINVDYFEQLYAALGLSRDAGITLLRSDATLIVRYPAADGSVGRDFGATESARRILSSSPGEVVRTVSAVDGLERLIVSRPLPGYPLRINVSYGVDAVLEEWHRVAWRIGAGCALLLGLILVAGAAARRARAAERQAAQERQHAQDAAAEYGARMRNLIEQLPVGIAMFDAGMRYMAVSERFIRDHPGAPQLTPADYVGRDHAEMFPAPKPFWGRAHERVLAGETAQTDAEPLDGGGDGRGWIRWHMAPWRLRDGSVGGAILFFEMVSARVEAERARLASEARLRESESIARLAMEAARIGSYRKDHATGLFHASQEARRLQGLPSGDAPVTLPQWRACILQEDVAGIDAALAAATASRAPTGRYDYRLRMPEDGAIRHMEARTRYEFDAAGRLVTSLGVIIDVTEKIAAAEALRQGEERLRLALEATEEGIWDWHIAGARLFYSDRWQEMLGFAPGELEPNTGTWYRLLHPEDRARADRALQAHFAGQVDHYACEVRMRHKDGRWVWMLDRGKVVERDASGQPIRMVGTQQDISRRKSAEDALAAREAELRTVLDTVPECVKVIAADGALFSMNRAGLDMIKVARFEDAAGCQVRNHVAERDRALWDSRHRSVCEGETHTVEYDCIAADGSVRRLESRSVPIRVPGLGMAHLSVARDVTALRQAEQEVRALQVSAMRATRSSAVGAMAAGLAHELNQPLSAVANYTAAARLMLKALPEQHAGLAELDGILRSASEQAVRAGEIVRRLRDYIRGADIDPQSVRVRAIVDDAAEEARRSLGPEASIDLATEVAEDAGHVFADPVQLQQVFANLVRNAAEATRGRSDARIVIGARRAEDGAGAEFVVRDNGPGLRADAARRVFEAFNSTKGNGLGVGLAICRAIVDAHGGRMWLDQREAGACFRFTIPDVTTLTPEPAR